LDRCQLHEPLIDLGDRKADNWRSGKQRRARRRPTERDRPCGPEWRLAAAHDPKEVPPMLRLLTVAVALAISTPALAFEVGQKAPDFSLKDPTGKVYTLRSFTKKVLLVWYEGANSKEQNRWLKTELKNIFDTNKIPSAKWESVGIANFQEHWISNAIIRSIIAKEQKTTASLILCDEDGRMMKSYAFRNGRSNIWMLDKDRVLRWKTSGPLEKARGAQLIRLLRRLVNE
jgi:predicted transcriptional regulator